MPRVSFYFFTPKGKRVHDYSLMEDNRFTHDEIHAHKLVNASKRIIGVCVYMTQRIYTIRRKRYIVRRLPYPDMRYSLCMLAPYNYEL